MSKESGITWIPFETQPAPEKGKPAISIEWRNGVERDEAVEQRVKELMNESIDYLKRLYGEDFPMPKQFLVIITKRGQHGALGAVIHIAVDSIKQFDKLDEPKKDQERSLFVHEIVHNVRDEEDLSMLAELIYMIEKGHLWRLANLEKIRKEGRLTTPYEAGLSTIATWLDTTVDDFLDPDSPKNLEGMKNIFRREVKSTIDEMKS